MGQNYSQLHYLGNMIIAAVLLISFPIIWPSKSSFYEMLEERFKALSLLDSPGVPGENSVVMKQKCRPGAGASEGLYLETCIRDSGKNVY